MPTAHDKTAYIDASTQDFEALLEREERVFLIETHGLAEALNHFHGFANRSGKAAYLWRPGKGLRSLKVSDMGVPGSTRLPDAFRYIATSLHYGIYCFLGFEREIGTQCNELLGRIANDRGGYERKIFLMSETGRVPGALRKLSAHVIYEPARQVKLRDGRWVV